MANNKPKKSGSGKASSLYENRLEGNSPVSVSIGNNKYAEYESVVCPHGNNYFLCQQCEIRIRNQDIVDRINCIMNEFYPDFVDDISLTPFNEYTYTITPNTVLSNFEITPFFNEFKLWWSYSNNELVLGDN